MYSMYKCIHVFLYMEYMYTFIHCIHVNGIHVNGIRVNGIHVNGIHVFHV